jgi:putative membrane protein insertion efficiency factor
MKTVLLYLIKLYQKIISPILGSNCRFYPTCSQYTYESIDKYGFLKGSYFSFKRITKCHPFHEGGYDPVK